MDEFFDAIQEYINAAKTKAADVAAKSAEALRRLADWIEAQTGQPNAFAAAPADTARLAQCEAELLALSDPSARVLAAAAAALK